jgi:hypothetical protein
MEKSPKITTPTDTLDNGIASKIRKISEKNLEKPAKITANLARKKKAINKKDKHVGKRKTVQKKHNIVKFNPNQNAEEKETLV